MKRLSPAKLITWLAWSLLLFDILLLVLVPAESVFRSVVEAGVYLLGLVGTLLVATTWLLIRYRALFRLWIGWGVVLVLFLLSHFIVQVKASEIHPRLFLFFHLLFITVCWSFVVVSAILLTYRDVGLGLIGWALVVLVWGMLLGWRFQGSLMELSIAALNEPGTPSPLWWLNSFLCAFWCLVPLGLLSFLGHTLWLFVREWLE